MPSTFIKAAELWLPSGDGSLLELHSGAFGSARRFGALSRSMCFGRGEGLPGRAWDEGKPILLADFNGADFRRAGAARQAGYSCAIALPFFRQQAITGVLVLFCSHGVTPASALELWHHDARITSDMTLANGAYGAGTQNFEEISHDTYLPSGVGLPGLAWQRGSVAAWRERVPGRPGCRAGALPACEMAAQAGFLRGLALPVGSRLDDCHVVTFLAGAQLPLAQRIERWVADDARTSLRRDCAFSELHGGRSSVAATLAIDPNDPASAGSIVRAWHTGVLVISEQPAAEEGAPAAAAAAIGAAALLAIPVVWDGVVAEVVALYL